MRKLRCGLITLEPPEGGLIAPIVEGFTDSGCEVQVFYRHSEWALQKCDFLVTYGPMQSMAWAIARLSQSKQLPPLVVWFTEQVPSPRPNLAIYWSAKARYLLEEYTHARKMPDWVVGKTFFSTLPYRAGRLRALGEMLTLKSRGLVKLICAFSETNASFLRHYGLPVAVVPMGYHPQFAEPLYDLERDVDIVFLGSTRDKRRSEIILDLENKLLAKGVNFVVKDGSPERGHVFGKERNLLLNRSKIMLNIMRQPWDDPIFRLLLAAPSGSMLLSEKLLPTSMGPYQPGKHFAMADLPDIVPAVEYYLSNEDERREIAAQAFEFVTKEVTMKNMAQKIILALGLQEA